MTLRFEDLESAIERNDVGAVVDQLKGATEAERKAVSREVLELGKKHRDFRGGRAAAGIAVLGTVGAVRQVREVLWGVAIADWVPEAVIVLSDRSPSWRADVADAVLARGNALGSWRLVRGMVRAGLVPKPNLPAYTTMMPHALVTPSVQMGWSVETQLVNDPGLLEDEVFRLFRVEGAAAALHGADGWLDRPQRFEAGKYVKLPRRREETWHATLARLARAGKVDFDRLLDECLGAFLRDFRPAYLGWYVSLHEDLAPSVDEMAPRAEAYARLLAADASVGVGLGQTSLETLLRAGRLDPAGLIRASPPALHRAEKGLVLKQLKLVELALKSDGALAPLAAEVLSPAAAHERPEVAEAVRSFLERRSIDAQLTAPAAEQPRAGSQSELRARAARLDGSSWTSAIGAALQAVDRDQPLPVALVETGPGARLPEPITDPEELVAAFTRLVEDARDPILLERVLAGAVRTARVPLGQRRKAAEPLAKRAAQQLPGWPSGLTGGEVRSMIASVAYTWATGTRVRAGFQGSYRDFALRHGSVDEHFAPVSLTGVFAVRCIEVIELVASEVSMELLSEPTHERGAVEVEKLVQRARRYGGLLGPSPPRYDLELAALRVAPSELMHRLADLPRRLREPLKEMAQELSRASRPEVISGNPDGERWDGHKDPVVLALARAAGREGSAVRTLTNLEDPLATYSRLSSDSEFSTGYGASIATWPLIAPWNPELVAAHLLRPLSRGLHTGKHDLASSAVSCLMHPDVALGPIAHLALAMGCIGAEGDSRTAAGDVYAMAAKDGRLQPALMAKAWVVLAGAGVFQAKRLEATLRPVAAQAAAGVRLAQCLDLALPHLVQSGTKDMHVLLRLAASVATTQSSCVRDRAIVELAGKKGSSELIRAARALVATQPSSATRGSLDLVEGLIDRAER